MFRGGRAGVRAYRSKAWGRHKVTRLELRAGGPCLEALQSLVPQNPCAWLRTPFQLDEVWAGTMGKFS